jgi:hypothetical protein
VENTGTGTTLLRLCYPQDQIPMFHVALHGEGPPEGSAFAPIWACVGPDKSIRLDPGEVRFYSLIIQGPNAWDGETGESYGALEGDMEIRLRFGCSIGPGCSSVAASNPFHVAAGGP